jgi:hypothetical protein
LLGRVNHGLPQTETGADAETLARMLGKLYEADLLAQDVLRGIEQNRALIVAPRSARIAWRMSRYTPRVMMRTIISGVRRAAAEQAAASGASAQQSLAVGSEHPEAEGPMQPV